MHTDKAGLIRELRRLKIIYVTLDRDGEPVTVEDGRILDARPPYQNQVWDPEYLDWLDMPEEDTYAPLIKADFDYWAEGLKR